MPLPVRSIRLEKRSTSSLDTLSGESGEIFFDAGQNTLRIYTANQSDAIVIADRTWVEENTFSGVYEDLTGKPTIVTDYSQLTGTPNLAAVATTGSYNDLTDAPDLGGLSVDISTINSIGDVDTETNPLVSGQLLEWNGTNWVNTTVSGFSDTNTTYTISNQASATGAEVVLTDSDTNISATEIVGGSNITVGINLSGQIEISSTLPSLSQLSDTVISTPQDGQLLGYNSGQWINVAAPVAQGGIELTDLSVTNGTANAGGSLSYDNTLGVFSFTPPDLSSYASLSSFSVTTSSASGGGSLSYSNGTFTFRPAAVSTLIELTDLSVVSNAASGSGSLAYSNTTGQFTYTPPDLSSLSADVVNDTTPQLGGDLDLNSSDITGTGNINITGTVSAASYSSSATGAPAITSASTITLTAPDGIIVSDSTDTLGTISIEKIDNSSLGAYLEITAPYGNTFTEGLKITGASSSLTFDVSSNQLGGGMLVTDGVLGLKAPAGIVMSGPVSEPTATGTIVSNELAFDVSNTSILDVTSTPAANFAINFTNVPTTTNVAQTYVMKVGTNSFNPVSITINGGSSVTLLWADGVAPSANGSINFYSFTIFSSGGSNPTVFGSMTSYS